MQGAPNASQAAVDSSVLRSRARREVDARLPPSTASSPRPTGLARCVHRAALVEYLDLKARPVGLLGTCSRLSRRRLGSRRDQRLQSTLRPRRHSHTLFLRPPPPSNRPPRCVFSGCRQVAATRLHAPGRDGTRRNRTATAFRAISAICQPIPRARSVFSDRRCRIRSPLGTPLLWREAPKPGIGRRSRVYSEDSVHP
jgi:hypothetical protein